MRSENAHYKRLNSNNSKLHNYHIKIENIRNIEIAKTGKLFPLRAPKADNDKSTRRR